MLKLDVITEQRELTAWVNLITIVKKPNKISVCLDPTKFNVVVKRGAYPTTTTEKIAANQANAKYFTVLEAITEYWQIELDHPSPPQVLCAFDMS